MIKANVDAMVASKNKMSATSNDMRETLGRMFSVVDEINGNVWSGTSQTDFIAKSEAAEQKAYLMPKTIDNMCNSVDAIAAAYAEADEMLSGHVARLSTDIF